MTLRRLRNIVLIGLFPFIEFAFLRLILHSYLNLRLGWGWFVSDYDWLLPSVFGATIGIFLLEMKEPRLFKFHLPHLFFNLGSLIVFILISAISPSSFFWWASLVIVFTSSAITFVPIQFYIRNANRMVIPFCGLIALSQVLYQHGSNLLWPFLFPRTAAMSCGTLQVFGGFLFGSLRCGFDGPEYYHLESPAFRIVLGTGCGGFDGMFFFLFAAGLFLFLNRKNVLGWHVPLLLVTGIVSMFFLNIVRIVLLFLIGFVLVQFLGAQRGYSVVMHVFHLNLGWVLYSLYLGFFFRRSFLHLNTKDRSAIAEAAVYA